MLNNNQYTIEPTQISLIVTRSFLKKKLAWILYQAIIDCIPEERSNMGRGIGVN
jgi:hypothetical protein